MSPATERDAGPGRQVPVTRRRAIGATGSLFLGAGLLAAAGLHPPAPRSGCISTGSTTAA